VGHFVEKYELPSFGRPLLGGFRKKNRRTEKAEGHRRGAPMEPNLDVMLRAKLLLNLPQKLFPARIVCRAGLSAEALRSQETDK
jgi:hypothetical protein